MPALSAPGLCIARRRENQDRRPRPVPGPSMRRFLGAASTRSEGVPVLELRSAPRSCPKRQPRGLLSTGIVCGIHTEARCIFVRLRARVHLRQSRLLRCTAASSLAPLLWCRPSLWVANLLRCFEHSLSNDIRQHPWQSTRAFHHLSGRERPCTRRRGRREAREL